MAAIIDKLLKSDVIVWSFPLYFYSIPSRLKALIDRQLPMSYRLWQEKAKAATIPVVMTCQGKNM
ncbi:MAG TPA: NAD(P)H-dependent oxidoreductase [Bacillota bacterium]|nr:NAD(P)H-dependent oxidoreductase [Bacillota bacterium]HOL09554.1 NAD(P)H-dependent oxidoreductase [Bacillota bacterium]HPO97475.1 NAD(P)H-dependent oxidoreductase [Bacillota bacterium]